MTHTDQTPKANSKTPQATRGITMPTPKPDHPLTPEELQVLRERSPRSAPFRAALARLALVGLRWCSGFDRDGHTDAADLFPAKGGRCKACKSASERAAREHRNSTETLEEYAERRSAANARNAKYRTQNPDKVREKTRRDGHLMRIRKLLRQVNLFARLSAEEERILEANEADPHCGLSQQAFMIRSGWGAEVKRYLSREERCKTGIPFTEKPASEHLTDVLEDLSGFTSEDIAQAKYLEAERGEGDSHAPLKDAQTEAVVRRVMKAARREWAELPPEQREARIKRREETLRLILAPLSEDWLAFHREQERENAKRRELGQPEQYETEPEPVDPLALADEEAAQKRPCPIDLPEPEYEY